MRIIITVAICACLMVTAEAAVKSSKAESGNKTSTEIPGTGGIPDLTKGGTLTRVDLRWAGPVGIFCGTWRPGGKQQKIEDVRQVQVLSIVKGSPADGVLKIDDVILGADGTGAAMVPLFAGADSALMPLADAINEAEARNPAILKLLVWRPEKPASGDNVDPYREVDLKSVEKMLKPYTKGQTLTISIKLQYMGRYSDTAPYNCEKSRNILRQGLKALYESDKPGAAWLGALCLLAGDDPSNPDNDKYQAKAKAWIYKMIEQERGKDWSPWMSGPRLIVLSEYYMKTKDQTVFPELVKRAEYHAGGVSWIGTSGHRWADLLPDGTRGRISGYGAINCSGTLGFLGCTLAQKAGVNSPIVDDAVRRQRIFFGHYAERGGIIYGEWYYWLSGTAGDDNGKHAMSALALGSLGDVRKAKFFTRMAALSSWESRNNAHGGPFFGEVWQPVAAAQGGVKSANLQFREIRWHLDLKRHYNGLRIDDPTHQKYSSFSEAATALLFYAAPLKQLCVTGRERNKDLELTEAEFAETAATKTFDESKLSDDELIASLSRYLGMLKDRATPELAKRAKANPDQAKVIITKLVALAGDKNANPTGRAGAAKALKDIKNKAPEPINSMMNAEITRTAIGMVKESYHYVRYAGAGILSIMPPEAVRPYGNDLMDAILANDRPTFPLDEDNPCRWDHAVMSEVFAQKVLSQGVDGFDRKKLIPALRSMLATPMSVARTTVANGIKALSLDDTLGIADSIIECLTSGSPFNAAGDGTAPACQRLLSQYAFEEGLFLSLMKDGENAVKAKVPQKYGAAAFTMQSTPKLMSVFGDQKLVQANIDSTKILEELKNTPPPKEMPKLKRIHSIKSAQTSLTLPAAQTDLMIEASNYAVSEEDTTYTWRKVYGAGKVNFAPNASSQSRKTTVSFTDQKPGKYRFEVTMSDTLGLTEVSKTVDVTLTDKSGNLPRNRPPQTNSQSLDAVAGLALPVTLSGSDPDGDDLGYVVTKQPSHGRLSGVGGKLVYTANYRTPVRREPTSDSWTDSFTFEAIDGQGETATGTVTFKVSDQNVGVVVYEGFDYTAGAIQGVGGEPSFGFVGLWTNTRGTKDYYLVDRGSMNDPSQPASLSYPSLPSSGGRLKTGKGWWPLTRALDTEVLGKHHLLENGHELWFSLFVANSSVMKFKFVGPDSSFGLYLDSKLSILTTLNDEITGEARNPYTREGHLKFDNGPHMFIGHCSWATSNTEPDKVEIYRVFDAPGYGPVVIEEPVCVMDAIIDQEKINKLLLQGFDTGAVDEIRIGPTRHSVMLGTKPLGVNKQ